MHDQLKQVFGLVKSTLNNEVFNEEIQNPEVYKIARENGFSGMVFKAIQKAKIDPSLYLEFQRDHYQYKERDILQTIAMEELHQIFNDNQIKHIFLKGAFLKTIYPESYMRSMGDIDILVEYDQMKSIHSLLPNKGFLLHSIGPTHDVFVKDRKIDIEIHPAIDSHFDEIVLHQFQDIWHKVELHDQYQYRFTSEYQILYLLSHLVKHLKSSGIGLRQVLDIGLLFHQIEAKIDLEKLLALLEATKLTKFFKTILWLNHEWFDYNYQYQYNEADFDPDFLIEVTQFMSSSGIHGKGNSFNRTLPALTKHSLGKKGVKGSKLRYLFHVGFPKLEDMRGTRKYLIKYPILLPYAWVSRWLYLIFRKGKRTKTKLKNMQVDHLIIEKQALLYKKIGL